MGNQEIELEKQGNQIWTPVQRSYGPWFLSLYTDSMLCVCREISSTLEMRMEITTGYLRKSRPMNHVINLQRLFNEYWDSDKREFAVLGQS